jgi:hypothetical protein
MGLDHFMAILVVIAALWLAIAAIILREPKEKKPKKWVAKFSCRKCNHVPKWTEYINNWGTNVWWRKGCCPKCGDDAHPRSKVMRKVHTHEP